MKSILISLLLFAGSSSFAADAASEKEIELLCNAVDSYLQTEQMDMALDYVNCMSSEDTTSHSFSEGLRVVSGFLGFNAPHRPTFEMICAVGYEGYPEVENVVGQVTCELTQ